MRLGSRPDCIRHTVVERCTSSTFDVAFCIIENNWIPPPPSAPPHLSRAVFVPCSLRACSVNRPPVRRQRGVCLASRRFRAAFQQQRRQRDGPEQLGQSAEGQHFSGGQGSLCRLERRLPASAGGQSRGSGSGVHWVSVVLPPHQLVRA